MGIVLNISLGDGRLETKNYKGKDMQEVAVAQWGVI
jgi:hypothetical protein